MRITIALGLALALGACNNHNYGIDPTPPSGDEDDTAEPVPDEPLPAAACHLSDPIDQSGWTRTYQVNWEGRQGTETVSGMGAAQTSTGTDAYLIKTELNTGSDTLTTSDYRGCGPNGQALWYESHVQGTASLGTGSDIFDGMDIMAIIAMLADLFGGGSGGDLGIDLLNTPTPGVPYLSDHATLNGGGILSYDFELMSVGQTADLFNIPNCAAPGSAENNATCVPMNGTLTFMGTIEVTVPAGTFTAYRVIDNRTEQWSENDPFGDIFDLGELFPMPTFGQSSDQDLISDLYYVPGIGLVKEQTKYANAGPGDWLVERNLTNFTGLTVAN